MDTGTAIVGIVILLLIVLSVFFLNKKSNSKSKN